MWHGRSSSSICNTWPVSYTMNSMKISQIVSLILDRYGSVIYSSGPNLFTHWSLNMIWLDQSRHPTVTLTSCLPLSTNFVGCIWKSSPADVWLPIWHFTTSNQPSKQNSVLLHRITCIQFEVETEVEVGRTFSCLFFSYKLYWQAQYIKQPLNRVWWTKRLNDWSISAISSIWNKQRNKAYF